MLGVGGCWRVLTGLISGDAWNLVVLSSLSTPHHGHTLVTYNHLRTTIPNLISSVYERTNPGITKHNP